ncbi:hypothetical protein ACHQM5_001609 [Ranunculus cassubicifolius]
MVKSASDKQVEETNEHNVRFKGVRKRKWGKYVSEIRLPNSRERIWLGSYDTAEKAARAFDAALYCLRGKQAKFNFPMNPPDIAGGTSLKPQEIQAVAAKFANENCSSSSFPSCRSSSSNSLAPLEYSSAPSYSDGGAPSYSDSGAPSYSDGGALSDSELTAMNNWPYLDFSETSTAGFGTFGGLDDYATNFLAPQLDLNYDDENQYYSDTSSCLWNF